MTSLLKHTPAGALISAIVATFFPLSASSAELAKGYADADGDLVADAPIDPKDWVNPSRLIFAYTPVEDPAIYRDVWTEFLAHLEKATGKAVEFFPVQSNAAQLEALRAGRLHVAAVNTGGTPVAVNLCGFVPFCMMAAADDSYGYEMEIIVPVDSPIKKVEDLKGKKIAFTAPTSNSGYKAPSVLLKSRFQMVAEKDYEPVFSGKHDNSILGVANGDYETAAVANSVLKRMISRGSVPADKLRSIYKSETFPTSAYGFAHNLDPELAKKIREAFFSFDWKGTGLEKEFGAQGEAKFIPITYMNQWEVVREIDKAMGVQYEIK